MEVLRDQDDAEDVAQDVFQGLLRRGTWEEIDGPARYFRSAGTKEALCLLRARRFLEPISLTEAEQLPLRGPGPEELVAGKELRRVLETQIRRLPKRCAKVAKLVMLGGLSHAEVAERLGVTVPAVQKQTARGREHLRRYLRRDENGDLRLVSTFVDGGGLGRLMHLP
jgi:RNA polymerase sigma-70 factor (ECF subfamily)